MLQYQYPKSIEVSMNHQNEEVRTRIYTLFGRAQFQELIEWSQQNLENARQRQDSNLGGMAFIGLGCAHVGLGNFDQAEDYFCKAVALAEKFQNTAILGEAYLELGALRNMVSSTYAVALEDFLQGYKLAEQVQNPRLIADALCGLGNVYKNMGQFPKAEGYLQKALKITRQHAQKRSEAHVLNSLGNYYINRGKAFPAIDHYTMALKIFEQFDDPVNTSMLLCNLGLSHAVHAGFRCYERGLNYLHQALAKARECRYIYCEMGALHALGQAYALAYKHDEAIDYYQQAQVLAERANHQAILDTIVWTLAEEYFRKRDYSRALDYYTEFMELNQVNGQQLLVAAVHVSIGNVYFDQGDYDPAFRYYNEAITLYQAQKQGGHAWKLGAQVVFIYVSKLPQIFFYKLKGKPKSLTIRQDSAAASGV
jgi:tetratricopeptide (TPR) repeat protein